MTFQTYSLVRPLEKTKWLAEALRDNRPVRQSEWTESIAVGSERFIATIKETLSIRAKGRTITASRDDAYQLREPASDYSDDFSPKKKKHIGAKNSHLWNICHDIPD